MGMRNWAKELGLPLTECTGFLASGTEADKALIQKYLPVPPKQEPPRSEATSNPRSKMANPRRKQTPEPTNDVPRSENAEQDLVPPKQELPPPEETWNLS